MALRRPPPHVGRSSRNSGRAGHRKRIGESRVRSATDSIRSSSVGSAQWMSSMRTTSGFSSARCSSMRRNAQTSSSAAAETSRPTEVTGAADMRGRSRHPATSGFDLCRSHRGGLGLAIPAACRIVSANRQVGDALAVWTGNDHAVPERSSRTPARNSATRRILPTPAAPRMVKRWHDPIGAARSICRGAVHRVADV